MASALYNPAQLYEGLTVALGHTAPDFQLQTDTGEYWRLSNHRGRVIALLFYPKDGAFYSTQQLCSLRDHWGQYCETGALIVGVSPGTVKEHRSFRKNNCLPIPLLADVDRCVTDIYCDNWLYPDIFCAGNRHYRSAGNCQAARCDTADIVADGRFGGRVDLRGARLWSER